MDYHFSTVMPREFVPPVYHQAPYSFCMAAISTDCTHSSSSDEIWDLVSIYYRCALCALV